MNCPQPTQLSLDQHGACGSGTRGFRPCWPLWAITSPGCVVSPVSFCPLEQGDRLSTGCHALRGDVRDSAEGPGGRTTVLDARPTPPGPPPARAGPPRPGPPGLTSLLVHQHAVLVHAVLLPQGVVQPAALRVPLPAPPRQPRVGEPPGLGRAAQQRQVRAGPAAVLLQGALVELQAFGTGAAGERQCERVCEGARRCDRAGGCEGAWGGGRERARSGGGARIGERGSSVAGPGGSGCL